MGLQKCIQTLDGLLKALEKNQSDEIIVRSNLTIILANKKFFDLPNFFADNRIHIISSPFYNKEKTDNQRGKGFLINQF